MLLKALTVVLHILVCCWALHNTHSREMDTRNASCLRWYYHDDEDKVFIQSSTAIGCKPIWKLEMGYCMSQSNSSLVVTQCSFIPTTHNFSQYHSIYQVLPKQRDQANNSLFEAFFTWNGFLRLQTVLVSSRATSRNESLTHAIAAQVQGGGARACELYIEKRVKGVETKTM